MGCGQKQNCLIDSRRSHDRQTRPARLGIIGCAATHLFFNRSPLTSAATIGYMNIRICRDADAANAAATDCLAEWLTDSSTRNVMVAGGNTPLELYRRIADRRLPLSHLNVFALDEYVGVPLNEPRNCANLLRSTVVKGWGLLAERFFALSSLEQDAFASVQEHERRIANAGGLDVIVLGLGQNGHLGFNEPGSAADSDAGVLELAPSSVEANREWFGGKYAPTQGATVGLKTILAAQHILVMAYGPHKAATVREMIQGPRSADCPASFLQNHSDTCVFVDKAAAAQLSRQHRSQ